MENYKKYKNLELSIEKIAKSRPTFRKNKPNSKNIKTGVSSFETRKYETLPACRGGKTNPIKPNSNPIWSR